MEPERSSPLSVSSRYWLVVAALLPVWMAVVGFVGPWTIRQLHAGRGPGFLVAVLGGRGRVPVDHYLTTWAQASRSLSVLLILATLLGYVILRVVVAARQPLPAVGEGAGAGLGQEWAGSKESSSAAA